MSAGLQIEIQAVSPNSLSSGRAQEGNAGTPPDDAKALPEGAQSSAEYTDVSANSPSGSGRGGGNATSSSQAEGTSDRQDSPSPSPSSSNEEGKKKKSSKSSSSKSGSARDTKVPAGSNSGTIGGRGTQEEYQQAKVRFMSPSGTGVCVSADSITLGEDQMGLLVTASFDEL